MNVKILQSNILPPATSESPIVKQIQNTTRNDIFDTILRDNWRESIPTRVSKFSPSARGWITELKTRFLTNQNLTPEKTAALVDLILWHEAQLVMLTKNPENTLSDGRIDLGQLANGIAVKKIQHFLHIQIYTREVEKHLAQLEGNEILSHGYVADFLRDIHTLQALGLRAPHISDILQVIASHPNLEFDANILAKYRKAVQSALNAHYWMDSKLQDTTLIQPNANIAITPIKGHSGVPIPMYEEDVIDEHARDFSLCMYPPSIIDVMSAFDRSIIYDLTRKTPPTLKKKGFFSTSHKPDCSRITLSQEERLQALRKQ